MAGVITVGSTPKLLWPGLNAIWGLSYDEGKMQWPEIFDRYTSTKNYEEDVGLTGTGLLKEKANGAAIEYDSMKQSYVTRYTHVTYGLGYIITREELEDVLYPQFGPQRTRALAFSAMQTKEIICANILNRAFSGSYPGADGVSLINAAHPLSGGTASNTLDHAADFSEDALEELLIRIGLATDDRGLKINISGLKLIGPPQLRYDFQRVLGNPERPATANRDINAIYQLGDLSQGFVINKYLTDPDAWFIKTDIPDGLKLFQRRPIEFGQDNDFETENSKNKVTERYSAGCTDWRGIFGSPGA